MNRTLWIAGGAGMLAALVILAWVGVIGSLGVSIFSAPRLDTRIQGFSPQRLFEESADSVVLVRSTFGSTAQGNSESLGSGFMVSKEGHIVTNAHVVEENGVRGEVEVTARRDGVELQPVKARIVGVDASSDTAILLVDPDEVKVKPLPLGDSSEVAVGEPVIAIGNPLGYSFTLTTGVVSGIGRALQAPNGALIPNGIQTDAAINQGNSGGPLIAADGRVIGVNEQIATRTGGFNGLGFAIPINMVKDIMGQLIASGNVRHGFLGVEGHTITPGIAEQLDLPARQGVLVARVQAGSAADQAELRGGDEIVDVQGMPYVVGGDIIIRIDDQAVTDMDDLSSAVSSRRPGEKVELTIIRDGAERVVTVTLGERA